MASGEVLVCEAVGSNGCCLEIIRLALYGAECPEEVSRALESARSLAGWPGASPKLFHGDLEISMLFVIELTNVAGDF